MERQLKIYGTPLLILAMFYFTFHNAPSVIEEHFNWLVLASLFTPLVTLWLGGVDIKVGVAQAAVLEVVYVLYARWYWPYRDRLSDGYFSFENRLKLDIVLLVFVVALIVAVVGRVVARIVKRAIS